MITFSNVQFQINSLKNFWCSNFFRTRYRKKRNFMCMCVKIREFFLYNFTMLKVSDSFLEKRIHLMFKTDFKSFKNFRSNGINLREGTYASWEHTIFQKLQLLGKEFLIQFFETFDLLMWTWNNIYYRFRNSFRSSKNRKKKI